MKAHFSFYFLFLIFTGFAQQDSVKQIKYSPDYQFKDGLILDIEQLKKNEPIPRSRILSNIDYASMNFYNKLLEQEVIYLYDNLGMQKEVQVIEIWGFCRNGILYINHNDEFNRIPVVGNVCHFTANKTVYQHNNYDNYYNTHNYNMRNPSVPSIEMHQYILDFETGGVYDYNVSTLEIVLMRDSELFDEFNSLRKKKKRKLKFLYLRKYNERNPLYLPKN